MNAQKYMLGSQTARVHGTCPNRHNGGTAKVEHHTPAASRTSAICEAEERVCKGLRVLRLGVRHFIFDYGDTIVTSRTATERHEFPDVKPHMNSWNESAARHCLSSACRRGVHR